MLAFFSFWMDEEMLELVGGHMGKKGGFSKEDKRGKIWSWSDQGIV
jgi:hypothetical protein